MRYVTRTATDRNTRKRKSVGVFGAAQFNETNTGICVKKERKHTERVQQVMGGHVLESWKEEMIRIGRTEGLAVLVNSLKDFITDKEALY